MRGGVSKKKLTNMNVGATVSIAGTGADNDNLNSNLNTNSSTTDLLNVTRGRSVRVNPTVRTSGKVSIGRSTSDNAALSVVYSEQLQETPIKLNEKQIFKK